MSTVETTVLASFARAVVGNWDRRTVGRVEDGARARQGSCIRCDSAHGSSQGFEHICLRQRRWTTHRTPFHFGFLSRDCARLTASSRSNDGP